MTMTMTLCGIPHFYVALDRAADIIKFMQDKNYAVCDTPTSEVEKWRASNQNHAERTVWSRCSAYYNDPKGNILVMVRPWDQVMQEKRQLAKDGYPCFTFE